MAVILLALFKMYSYLRLWCVIFVMNSSVNRVLQKRNVDFLIRRGGGEFQTIHVFNLVLYYGAIVSSVRRVKSCKMYLQ